MFNTKFTKSTILEFVYIYAKYVFYDDYYTNELFFCMGLIEIDDDNEKRNAVLRSFFWINLIVN